MDRMDRMDRVRAGEIGGLWRVVVLPEPSRMRLRVRGFARDNEPMRFLLATLVGLAGGVFSGLFGVGGGIIVVPGLALLLRTDLKVAIGTSLAVIVPTAATGVFKHQQLGQVDWKLAALLAPSAIVGGLLGASLTTRLTSLELQKLFGVLLVILGLRLVLMPR